MLGIERGVRGIKAENKQCNEVLNMADQDAAILLVIVLQMKTCVSVLLQLCLLKNTG